MNQHFLGEIQWSEINPTFPQKKLKFIVNVVKRKTIVHLSSSCLSYKAQKIVKAFFYKILPSLSHHAIDPISPCLTLASALTRGTALPDNILLHLTITGYNTLPATNTTDTHSNSTLDSTSFFSK